MRRVRLCWCRAGTGTSWDIWMVLGHNMIKSKPWGNGDSDRGGRHSTNLRWWNRQTARYVINYLSERPGNPNLVAAGPTAKALLVASGVSFLLRMLTKERWWPSMIETYAVIPLALRNTSTWWYLQRSPVSSGRLNRWAKSTYVPRPMGNNFGCATCSPIRFEEPLRPLCCGRVQYDINEKECFRVRGWACVRHSFINVKKGISVDRQKDGRAN